MNAAELARQVRAAGLDMPVVLLAYDSRELDGLRGPPRPLGARARVPVAGRRAHPARRSSSTSRTGATSTHDTRSDGRAGDPPGRGQRPLLLVVPAGDLRGAAAPLAAPDRARALNLSHKILRMRARPKILLCTHASRRPGTAFTALPGRRPRRDLGHRVPARGRASRRRPGWTSRGTCADACPDVPILLQSSRPRTPSWRARAGRRLPAQGLADAADRAAPLHDRELRLRRLRLPPARRARRWRAPPTCAASRSGCARCRRRAIAYHAERNHFSNWLKARTEFALAQELRPRKLADFATRRGPAARPDRARSPSYRRERSQAAGRRLRPRARSTAPAASTGSAAARWAARRAGWRSCACCSASAARATRSPACEIAVPPAVVLGTDVFDRFLDENDLRDFALDCDDDAEIERALPGRAFPRGRARRTCWPSCERVRLPARGALVEPARGLAVPAVHRRLRDVHAGEQRMPRSRCGCEQLVRAVKRVYASTFSRHAKDYLGRTPYRLEEEKMAVILQRIVGAAARSPLLSRLRGRRPLAQLLSRAAARSRGRHRGGRARASGGPSSRAANCLRFCPRYPRAPARSSRQRARRAAPTRSASSGRCDLAAEADEPRPREATLRARRGRGRRHARRRRPRPTRRENDAVYDGVVARRRAAGDLRADPQAGPLPAGRAARAPAGAGRAGAWARRSRSSSR